MINNVERRYLVWSIHHKDIKFERFSVRVKVSSTCRLQSSNLDRVEGSLLRLGKSSTYNFVINFIYFISFHYIIPLQWKE